MTYHNLLREGKRRLEEAGYTEQSAQLLLVELCSQYDVNLYMEMESPVNEQVQTDYLEALHRMELQEPMSYILGYEWFYGYKFFTDPSVLIPRPETEELVSLILAVSDEKMMNKKTIDVFDVATGSGAIGISLALEEPRMHVTASDISLQALETAQKNAQALGADVKFLVGSMLEPFIQAGLTCDILACNPPYIPEDEVMEESVINYEPHIALFGGKDGLKFYEDVFAHAKKVMNPGGFLAFEIGYNQKEALTALAAQYFDKAQIDVHQDINGKDRMLLIQLKGVE